MDQFIIDPNYIIKCEEINVSPYLLMLGVFVIVFMAFYLGFPLLKSAFVALNDGYQKVKKRDGALSAKIELFEVMISFKLLFRMLVLVGGGFFLALQAVNMALSLINSNCF